MSDADGELTARQYDTMAAAYRTANDARGVTACYERPATIGLLGDVRGRRVLDAGCGPGTLSRWLAGQGAIVTAIDVSPEMVRIARDRLGDSARVIRADLARPLDFAASASTDLIVSSLALHYLENWDAPLAEFHRILTPGGAVVFSTHHPAADWQMHSRTTTLRRSASTRPGTWARAALRGHVLAQAAHRHDRRHQPSRVCHRPAGRTLASARAARTRACRLPQAHDHSSVPVLPSD